MNSWKFSYFYFKPGLEITKVQTFCRMTHCRRSMRHSTCIITSPPTSRVSTVDSQLPVMLSLEIPFPLAPTAGLATISWLVVARLSTARLTSSRLQPAFTSPVGGTFTPAEISTGHSGVLIRDNETFPQINFTLHDFLSPNHKRKSTMR